MKLGMNLFAIVLNGFLGAFVAMFPALALEWFLQGFLDIPFDSRYIACAGFGLGSGITLGLMLGKTRQE